MVKQKQRWASYAEEDLNGVVGGDEELEDVLGSKLQEDYLPVGGLQNPPYVVAREGEGEEEVIIYKFVHVCKS